MTVSIIISVLLSYSIYYHRIRANPKNNRTYISHIDKNSIVFPASSKFNFFSVEKPSITINDLRIWDKTTAFYSINDDSLNERFSYDTFKSEGIFRIITLGDSFTFGHFVDTSDNWTEVFEDLLNNNISCKNISKFEVINMGKRGFDIPYITKMYNDYGLKYHPDLIIWFESGSGFTRHNELMQPEIVNCQEKALATMDSKPEEYYDCWKQAETKISQQYPDNMIQNFLSDWMNRFFLIRGDTPVLLASFNALEPKWKEVLYERAKNNSNVLYFDKITDINFLELFPDYHPNQAGHKSIASDFFTFMRDNLEIFLECDK